ncbi:hypothetical protein P8452_73600 [Trifolium repens]|nr:hypothetical protein P8452_73600 [Trifolium repens]
MTCSASKFYTIFIFFHLVIILLIYTCEPLGMFRRRCSKRSQSGKVRTCVFYNSGRNSVCVNFEHAIFGVCQVPYCHCYFNCSEYNRG